MATMTTPSRHGLHGSVSLGQGHDLEISHDHNNTPSSSPSQLSSSFPTSAVPNPSGPPLPNPPFVFPAREVSSSAPLSFSRATGRRPLSAIEPSGLGSMLKVGAEGARTARKSGPQQLPSFSFNPSESLKRESGTNSPPLSPSSTLASIPIAPRSGGHRRGGSEFIGGGSGAALMSTSPATGDGVLPSPSTAVSLGPSAGRRGHAHRRSAAVSSHDLSMILQPPSVNTSGLGGSAPTTPSLLETQQFTFSKIGNLTSSSSDPAIVSKDGAKAGPSSLPNPAPIIRNRVGFSDTVEFIPRPLSLVSSDTSSTITMRPGHSVSGSISSVLSASGSLAQEQYRLTGPAPSIKSNDSRPSTAGAVLGSSTALTGLSGSNTSPVRRNSTPLTLDFPANAAAVNPGPSTPKGTRKYIFFGHESSSEASPTKPRPVSAGSSERARSALSTPSSPGLPSNVAAVSMETTEQSQRRGSIKKPSKKQKRVKSWAGSILMRKPRPRSQKTKPLSRRSPTPPLRSYEPSRKDRNSFGSDVDAAKDGSIPALPNLDTNFSSWKPRQVSPPEDELMSPMIDLDAALGPFNTPSAYDAEWEASQRGGKTMKRRMHSGAPSRGFMRMDLPYHRRSESAPEMENPRFPLHRLGNSSTMADVFEEDEEDDWEEMKPVPGTPKETDEAEAGDSEEGSGMSIGINVVEDTTSHENKSMDWTIDESNASQRGLKRKGSGLSEGDGVHSTSSASSEKSGSSIREEVIVEEERQLETPPKRFVVGQDTSTRSSESTTPPLPPKFSEDLIPVDVQQITFQPPFLTPTSQHSTFHSPFPSPRTPMSYDTRGISTARSSLTDEQTFQSLLLGEPGPEIRMSVDEAPSLTSSASTRDELANPALNNPQFRGGQRSVSVSGPVVSRKRSSMASLTRLLHSSHGERSKLSIEERAADVPEIREKVTKGKRFSRMMQFWKPKAEADT